MSPRKRGASSGAHIGAIAARFQIHPQTLRLYEREGLLQPSRSRGNTRVYTEKDLERLEVILHLTRDLGVNLAGVEIILNMRETIQRLQAEPGRRGGRDQVPMSVAGEATEALVPIARDRGLQRLRRDLTGD